MSDQPDFSQLMQEAQNLQAKLAEARDESARQVLTGTAANGAVKVEVTGGLEFQAIRIDPSLAGDVEMLEDVVLAAVRDAVTKVNDLNEQAVGNLLG